MSDSNIICKICKVFPMKYKRITGILPDQKAITEPGIYHLNLKEIRRCMSYADVFEQIDGGDVLLTIDNYTLDNSKAEVYPAKDIPAITDSTIHYGYHAPKKDVSPPNPSESTPNIKENAAAETQKAVDTETPANNSKQQASKNNKNK